MGPQPWHGLSHTRAWGHVGESYSTLAQTERQDRRSRLPGETCQNAAPAGVLSSTKVKGAGTFQLQESQAQKGKLSSFPKETYPSDFKTTKQLDFDTELLNKSQMPARARRPADSGIMLGSNHNAGMTPRTLPPQVTAGPAQARLPLSDGTMRDTGGIQVPAYNIINGDLPQHVDMEKYWHGNQMDFRRRR